MSSILYSLAMSLAYSLDVDAAAGAIELKSLR